MILDRQRTVRVALPPLELFLRRVRKTLNLRKTDVTVCLVSDAAIARMNEAFRKKHGPTDVLSFPAEDSKRPKGRGQKGKNALDRARQVRDYIGDIAISPAAARRNAKEDGRPLQAELRILILHGVLHLLGYDHESDQGQMNRLEQRLRRRFGLR